MEGEGAGVGTEALLHAATKAGKVEVVKTLLDRRTVAVDLKDEEGDTALHVAARCTSTPTSPYLSSCSPPQVRPARDPAATPCCRRRPWRAQLGQGDAHGIARQPARRHHRGENTFSHFFAFSSSTHTFCSSSRKSLTPASPPKDRATLCLSPSPTPSWVHQIILKRRIQRKGREITRRK